jgi:hypothetical protein
MAMAAAGRCSRAQRSGGFELEWGAGGRRIYRALEAGGKKRPRQGVPA